MLTLFWEFGGSIDQCRDGAGGECCGHCATLGDSRGPGQRKGDGEGSCGCDQRRRDAQARTRLRDGRGGETGEEWRESPLLLRLAGWASLEKMVTVVELILVLVIVSVEVMVV